MAVDLEKILRPVDQPDGAVPAQGHVQLASGETMVVRQIDRDEVPDPARTSSRCCTSSATTTTSWRPASTPSCWPTTTTACRTSTCWSPRSTASWPRSSTAAGPPKDVGMSLPHLALRRGPAVGAHAFAAKMEYHIDIVGQNEVLIVAESPIGFRRWMIEYQLEKRFDVPHELGGVPSYALTKDLFDPRATSWSSAAGPCPRTC
jgi:hypothetical protein